MLTRERWRTHATDWPGWGVAHTLSSNTFSCILRVTFVRNARLDPDPDTAGFYCRVALCQLATTSFCVVVVDKLNNQLFGSDTVQDLVRNGWPWGSTEAVQPLLPLHRADQRQTGKHCFSCCLLLWLWHASILTDRRRYRKLDGAFV